MNAVPNYNRFPGPGDLPGDNNHPNSPHYDGREAFWDAVDAEVRESLYDDAAAGEAEQWIAGDLDESYYSAVNIALARLHETEPSDLLGSPLLEQLYRLARQPHDAIVGQLRDAATARMERAA